MQKAMMGFWVVALSLGILSVAGAADNIENYATADGFDLNSVALAQVMSNTTVTTYLGLPQIGVAKTATILDSAFAATTVEYVIPDMIIQYDIYVTNDAGSSSPKSLQIMDLIPTNTSYRTNGGANQATLSGTSAGSFIINSTANGGGAWGNGELADAAAGDSTNNGIGIRMASTGAGDALDGDFTAAAAVNDVQLTFYVKVETQ